MMVIHVDDILLAATSKTIGEALCKSLGKHFEVTFKDNVTAFIGLLIERTSGVIRISQPGLIDQILKEYDVGDHLRSYATPYCEDGAITRRKPEEEKVNVKMIQSILGRLQYLAYSTRPDLLLALQKVAVYASDPGPQHLKALKRILRYLSGSRNL